MNQLKIPLFRLKLVREAERPLESNRINSPSEAAAILGPVLTERPTEGFGAVFLTTQNTIITYKVISEGGLAAAIVEPRSIFQWALAVNASSLILFHNHPSGNPEPSREDIAITNQLVEAGKFMGIAVVDHLIITPDGNFTSLAERGLIN